MSTAEQLQPRRPIRIANCSGATPDPPQFMLSQATAHKLAPSSSPHAAAQQPARPAEPVDVITGDYLAEANLASDAEAYHAGTHPGWIPSCLAGIELTLDELRARKGELKIIVNGGGLNPAGLAGRVRDVIVERYGNTAAVDGGEKKGDRAEEGGYLPRVAYVDGDDLLGQVEELLKPVEYVDAQGRRKVRLPHLDAENERVQLARDTVDFLGLSSGSSSGGLLEELKSGALAKDSSAREKPPTRDERRTTRFKKKVVAANAYLGCRAIRAALEMGADIVICGRVADASPVMGAAAWWHGWADEQFDELAGALVAGHLIECSTYGTGGNFAGFDELMMMGNSGKGGKTGSEGDEKSGSSHPENLWDLACPIAEVSHDGTCVITKHPELNGFVTEEVVKCQFLYELQGNIYLNSDVKADLYDIRITQEGDKALNRVHVSGIKGHAPPPTTKLAVFYQAGWQGEFTVNATGYATAQKFELQEYQVRRKLSEWGVSNQLDVLEFQRLGMPEENPRTQLGSTTSLRVFAQSSKSPDAVRAVVKAWSDVFMQHFPGMHCSLDLRQITTPLEFLGYFPAVVEQERISEGVNILDEEKKGGEVVKRVVVGPPRVTEKLEARDTYDASNSMKLASFGETRRVPLGDVLLARSGDKGANVNVGFTPRASLSRDSDMWEWMRSYLSIERMKEIMGDDWKEDEYHVERVEFAGIKAVHYVVYGVLGRGVSSSARLDSLGKGFGEWLRAVHADVPVQFLDRRWIEREKRLRSKL